jgi:hypothetical protein
MRSIMDGGRVEIQDSLAELPSLAGGVVYGKMVARSSRCPNSIPH